MTIDFTNYKFRCSALGNLMVGGTGGLTEKQKELLKTLQNKSELTEKQAIALNDLIQKRDAPPELSETTKSYLLELWIEEAYGRRRDISNKYTEKGLYCEEDAIDMLSKLDDRLLIKNKTKLENEFICGTPDLIEPEIVTDTKCSYDMFTFAQADGTNKDYYWQAIGYMTLAKRLRYRLAYCLCNTPEHLIVAEKSRQMYLKGIQSESQEQADMEAQVDRNHTFDDVPLQERIKIFNFNYKSEDYERLKERIIICRNYMNTLSLNGRVVLYGNKLGKVVIDELEKERLTNLK